MIEPENGQSQSEAKPKGRFTGERLLRERPRVYRKVVELLAEPGMSINQITKFCRVSEHTVRAVRDREAVSIAERLDEWERLMGAVARR
jgi:DNA-directed RNA polymerase specialized sigma24 family protein